MTDNDIIVDAFEKQKAEFERLKALNERLSNNAFTLKYIYELEERLKTAKVEAVKEFAEKVNNLTWYRINSQGKLVVGANSEIHIPLYKAEDIDNLLKEKVGGADG